MKLPNGYKNWVAVYQFIINQYGKLEENKVFIFQKRIPNYAGNNIEDQEVQTVKISSAQLKELCFEELKAFASIEFGIVKEMERVIYFSPAHSQITSQLFQPLINLLKSTSK